MNLNELESLELLQKLNEHLIKNQTTHLLDQVFNIDGLEEEVGQLHEQVRDLEEEKSTLEDNNMVLSARIDEAISKMKRDQEITIKEFLKTNNYNDLTVKYDFGKHKSISHLILELITSQYEELLNTLE